MLLGPHHDLSQTAIQRLAQVIAQAHGPEAKGRLPPVRCRGEGQINACDFGSKLQLRDKIA